MFILMRIRLAKIPVTKEKKIYHAKGITMRLSALFLFPDPCTAGKSNTRISTMFVPEVGRLLEAFGRREFNRALYTSESSDHIILVDRGPRGAPLQKNPSRDNEARHPEPLLIASFRLNKLRWGLLSERIQGN